MNSAWELLFLLFVPGLIGVVVLMGWLEDVLTCRMTADDVVHAWRSMDSPDDLEREVGRIVERVMANAR